MDSSLYPARKPVISVLLLAYRQRQGAHHPSLCYVAWVGPGNPSILPKSSDFSSLVMLDKAQGWRGQEER